MDWGATQNTCEPSMNDTKHAQPTTGTATTFAATLTSMSLSPDLISKTKKLGVDLKCVGCISAEKQWDIL